MPSERNSNRSGIHAARIAGIALRASVLALLATVSTETAGAETVVYNPKSTVVVPGPRGGAGNAYPLDWCYTAGQRCGREAATNYCRQKRFGDVAIAFKTGHHIETWIAGDQRKCHGSYCTAFIEITCARIEGVKVKDPKVRGLLADNCRNWAQDCGQGGALAYCQSRNFPFVRAFRVYTSYAGSTWVIGSNRRCDGELCRGLSYVECGSTLVPANR